MRLLSTLELIGRAEDTMRAVTRDDMSGVVLAGLQYPRRDQPKFWNAIRAQLEGSVSALRFESLLAVKAEVRELAEAVDV